MVCQWFSAEKKEGEGVAGAEGFVRRVVAAAMGCFFGCFRIRDSHSHLIPTAQEVTVSHNKNALSSLFLSDDIDGSLRKGGEGLNSLHEELDVRELKDEAKFLKACGTLLETPVEIRKASRKFLSTQYKEEESLNFNSWLPSASIEKLKLEDQPDESPAPVIISEAMGAGSSIDSPSRRDSVISNASSDIQTVITPIDGADDETHSSAISSVSPEDVATNVPCRNKSVRFECESDSPASSSASSSQHPKQSGSAGKYSVAKKMYEDQISVCPFLLDPVEYPSEWKESKDENSDPNHLRGPLEPNDEAALKSTPVPSMLMEDLSLVKDKKDEVSSSSWLKPHSPNHDSDNELFGPTSGKNILCGTTPGDRPILGLVQPTGMMMKPLDQKVSWHATPFEVRLEKALSEETFIPRRKHIAGTPPVQFNEADESDTASSGLQSSAHPNSVVSF
ncbi:protein JASON [Sesamum angolense]|uniref:Protein JASON n=1 Tax=Sesamum angolense TaxID=2727404 RepID=A0AAE2BI63_9LAMI|nr:protein JASON [Sesamum angolense]